MLDRLNNIYQRWFENQTAFRLFATSLLLVYEGDCSQPISPNELLAIRLVDFAHAIPGDAKPDKNILFRLRKFIEFLILYKFTATYSRKSLTQTSRDH